MTFEENIKEEEKQAPDTFIEIWSLRQVLKLLHNMLQTVNSGKFISHLLYTPTNYKNITFCTASVQQINVIELV